MFCKFCGNQLHENAKFCTQCGNIVENVQAEPQAQADSQAPTELLVQNEPRVQADLQTPTELLVQNEPQVQYASQPEPQYAEPPVSPQPNYNYQYSYQTKQSTVHDSPEANSKRGSILTMGILSLAFACTFILSFLGIIFGSIAMGKANDYIRIYGETKDRATVGRSLGKAGLIAGIVMTALFVLYIILIVIVAIEASSSYYYYY